MKDTIRGAVRSKTVWINVALAALSGLELMGSHITELMGPKWSAGIVMFGALVNIVVRAYTSQTLAEKAS